VDFYAWDSSWWNTQKKDFVSEDEFRKFLKSIRQTEDVSTRRKFQEFLSRNGVQAWVEPIWAESGRPYYNVHPMLVGKLARVNLSKVPANFLEAPHNLKVVHIRFAEPNPAFTIAADVEHGGVVFPAGVFVRGFLFYKPSDAEWSEFYGCARPGKDKPQHGMICLVDFGLDERQFGYLTFYIGWDTDVMLDVVIENGIRCSDKIWPNQIKEIQNNALRVAVTIGFLSNSNDDLIEPDVLSKDRSKYTSASLDEKSIIEDRAIRRGKLGWNVGNDIIFVERPWEPAHRNQGDGSRKLKWAHIRAGHPHAVRYGENKSKVKIMFFRSGRVGKDLPFKPDTD
jgi:hypothetical protein